MLTIITNNQIKCRERDGIGARNNPEQRQKNILDGMKKLDCQIIIDSEYMSTDWLANIHDPEYLHFLKNSYRQCIDVNDQEWMNVNEGLVPSHYYKVKPHKSVPLYKLSGYYGSDFMTPIYDDTYHNVMISAHQAYKAAELSLTLSPVYALVCSLGHHAKYREYGGYCFVNNAVVAAYRLTELGKKVAVLDLDYHAGNGTAELIHDNPKLNNISAYSIHCNPILDYPSFEGYVDDYDNDKIHNFPLDAHITWDKYKGILIKVCEMIKKTGVDAIVIAFGADTFINDCDASPLGKFQLGLNDYGEMGMILKDMFGDLPMVVTQEGGYDMDNVAEILFRFMGNLI